jgi:DNA-binding response OmpR family regulator/HPt (histidine-containing phosphotransfer) domain-containing protein
MKILVIDDDEVLVDRLTADLTAQNYIVDSTTDGISGWAYAQSTPYDLVVLDISLPGLDGVSLCQRLRQTGYKGAILLLTARSSSDDKVLGLNAGADDYLVKPYTLAELTARLRALRRRPQSMQSLTLHWGAVQLDANASQVTVAGHPLALTPKEYGLLELFLRYPDRIFSNTVLLERLWSLEEAPGAETIRTHIKRLRHKLKQAGVDGMIENVYGMGYRLTPPPPEAAPSAAPEIAPEVDPAKAEAARTAAIATLDRFRPTLVARLDALSEAAAALRSQQLPLPIHQAATQAAHNLAGSLGLFGLGAGSELARQIETWLERPHLAEGDRFSHLVDQLQRLVTTLPGHDSEPSSAPPTITAPPATPLPPVDRARVLAVDDDPLVLDHLQRTLPPWGLEVVSLTDARLVINHLESNPVDVLLIDLDMPHLGGLELCQRLRQSDRWQTLPILFLTACRDPSTIHRIYQAGADDYLPKPTLGPELVSRIFQRLERGRLLQALAGTDPLTGLPNRQQGTIQLNLLLRLAQRQRCRLDLLLLRLAPAPPSPALIQGLGQGLARVFPDRDVLARWGKTDLLVGLWESDLPSVATYLRRQLPAHWIPGLGYDGLWLGEASFPADGDSLTVLQGQACDRLAPLPLGPYP